MQPTLATTNTYDIGFTTVKFVAVYFSLWVVVVVVEVVVLGMNSECPSPTLSSGGFPFTLLCDLGCNQASPTEIRVPKRNL